MSELKTCLQINHVCKSHFSVPLVFRCLSNFFISVQLDVLGPAPRHNSGKSELLESFQMEWDLHKLLLKRRK